MKYGLKEKIINYRVPIILSIGMLLILVINSNIYKIVGIEGGRKNHLKSKANCEVVHKKIERAKKNSSEYADLKRRYKKLKEEYHLYDKNTAKVLYRKMEEIKKELEKEINY